jgi:hypothetical protein
MNIKLIPQGEHIMKKLWMIRYSMISRNVVDEALIDDKDSDGDDYRIFQGAARNKELVPYDIPRKEENEKVLIKYSNYDHLHYES